MKTQRKFLNLKKIQIAKINSFNVLGRGTIYTTLVCTIQGSRTPKGGRTQTDSYQMDCEGSV